MRLVNSSNYAVLSNNLSIADTFAARLKGLMGRSSLPAGEGLALVPCNSIHMLFMRFPLDVVFTDKCGRILHIAENIKPWRISRIVKGAHMAVELPAGTVGKTFTAPGDVLRIES